MELWTIISIIAGVVGVAGILAFTVPGVSDFFQVIVGFFRDVFNFILTSMPKPLKVILFLILFSSIGVFTVNFIIGTQYVCVDNNVYHVPFMYGLAIQSWIDLEGAPVELTVESDSATFDENTWRVDQNGEVKTVSSLAPMNDLTKRSKDEMLRSMPTEQFNNMFFDLGGAGGIIPDEYVNYDICYNAEDGSCLMFRRTGLGSKSKCHLTVTGVPTGDWSRHVGTLRYQYFKGDELSASEIKSGDAQQDVLKVFHQPDRPVLDGYIEGIVPFFGADNARFIDLNDCGATEGLLEDFDYQEWVFTNDPWDNTPRKYTARIYNADRPQIFMTDDFPGNKEVGDERLFFKASQKARVNFLKDLHDVGTPVKNGIMGGIVDFQCDKDTVEEFDTKMTVLNMDVFSTEFMIFIFVIMGVVAVWKFWSGF